ncbi:type II toxin-antitoxin system antitoxin SocA domain-containing protein [Marinitenerispora sediminis]|nr:type II toxin-antitoxin system antitoxin SocA domain-containing protein [Marinitenerispora sediminis]
MSNPPDGRKEAHGMSFSQPDDPLLRSTLALLKSARDHKHTLNRTKIAKLLYLADLKSVEDGGVPFSGATWRWENYGPFDSALYRVEESLTSAGIVERVDDRGGVTGEVRLRLVQDVESPLSAELDGLVQQVVTEHGAKSAVALRDLSYETSPMLAAQAGGTRGVLIDLNRARRRRQYEALKERYRKHLARRAPRKNDPGVGEELREEMAASSGARRRATMKALGEE